MNPHLETLLRAHPAGVPMTDESVSQHQELGLPSPDVPAADLRHGEVGQIDRFRIHVSKQVLAYTPPKPTTLRWAAGVWTTK